MEYSTWNNFGFQHLNMKWLHVKSSTFYDLIRHHQNNWTFHKISLIGKTHDAKCNLVSQVYLMTVTTLINYIDNTLA